MAFEDWVALFAELDLRRKQSTELSTKWIALDTRFSIINL